VHAVTGPDGRTYYHPKDVADFLGWNVRRVKANFEWTNDRRIVEAVLRQLRRPGRPVQWVCVGESVDGHPLIAEKAVGPAPLDPVVERLQDARLHALEHRSRLLDQLEQAYEQLLEHVRNEKLLLDEVRLFEFDPARLFPRDVDQSGRSD
jgi:hypothetical protein